jgi:4-deoxy-L-threo-5-hexosulose-uronate ketol-isomerase
MAAAKKFQGGIPIMEIRYSNHPNDVKKYDTDQLRKDFLIQTLFAAGELRLVYSHNDRFITGSAVPVKEAVKLEADAKDMGAPFFLARRELGVINIGAKGTVNVDGTAYELDNKDCLYVGLGAKEVTFESADPANPAKFYLNSTPAHKEYPTVKASQKEANPRHLGAIETSNERTIYQYIHENGIKSCQLVMGLTQLDPGNMWNTMPSHTHERRMEVYLYFDMPENGVVFHMMGQPTETRHIVTRNQEAVISPSWSIHSGVGTTAYTFIWGMAGENQAFDDMDPVAMTEIR